MSVQAISSVLEVWSPAQNLLVLGLLLAAPLGGNVVWIGLMLLAVIMGLVQED